MSSGNGNAGGSGTLKDHATEFLRAVAEITVAFGKGCCDIVRQSVGNDDSFLVRNLGRDSYLGRRLSGPCRRLRRKLTSFNDYLPEDKDPARCWSVIFFVAAVAFAGQLLVRKLLRFLSLEVWCVLCGVFVVWLLRKMGLEILSRIRLDLVAVEGKVKREDSSSGFEILNLF